MADECRVESKVDCKAAECEQEVQNPRESEQVPSSGLGEGSCSDTALMATNCKNAAHDSKSPVPSPEEMLQADGCDVKAAGVLQGTEDPKASAQGE